MNKDSMFELVARQRLSLCDQAESFSEDQWNAASCCEGWRVRDVLGHLVSLQDVPTWKFVVGVVSLAGFNRRANRFALEYGRRDPHELILLYRSHAESRVAPPFVGPIAPLSDIVVHALDIQRPLSLPSTTEEDATQMALDALCRGLQGFTPKKLVRGLRFEATDLDWNCGSGSSVRGTSADLLHAIMGRSIDWSGLDGDGDGVDTLRSRL